jgi:hypothetical protein
MSQLTAIQQLGAVSRTYEATAQSFADIALAAAQAEANYRKVKAVYKLRAMVDGASAVKAEAMADADDDVSAACLAYKTSGAVADSTRARLAQLREQVAVGRSVLVNDRESDRVHAQGSTP